MDSKHWRKDRQTRSRIIAQIGLGQVARPNQIKRYYAENEAPQEIINLAFEHMRAGYNKI